MKLSLRVPVPAAARTYATRRPERPPLKIKDPLQSPNATHHQVTPSLTFIHRPPPTAPTPFSLTTAPSSPLLLSRPPSTSQSSDAASSSSTIPGRLPPLLKRPVEKPTERLSEEQIEEMRKLRTSDPLKYTRSKLAKQFGCSPLFVPIAAPLSKAEKRTALERIGEAHETIRSRWGEKKKMVMAIRQKRRELW